MQAETVKKRLGEFLILLIYLLFDVFAVWPESHSLALLALVLGVTALLLLDGAFSYGAILLIGVVLVAVSLFIYYFAPDATRVETEAHGWLLPASEPTPPNTCAANGMFAPGSLLFMAGTNAIVSTDQGKSLVLSIGDNNQLW